MLTLDSWFLNCKTRTFLLCMFLCYKPIQAARDAIKIGWVPEAREISQVWKLKVQVKGLWDLPHFAGGRLCLALLSLPLLDTSHTVFRHCLYRPCSNSAISLEALFPNRGASSIWAVKLQCVAYRRNYLPM